MMIIGRALQIEALTRLIITPDNALQALALGAKLEADGTYGPTGVRGGDSTPMMVQTNTVVYQQVLQIVQSGGKKKREQLGRKLKQLIDSRAAKSSR